MDLSELPESAELPGAPAEKGMVQGGLNSQLNMTVPSTAGRVVWTEGQTEECRRPESEGTWWREMQLAAFSDALGF